MIGKPLFNNIEGVKSWLIRLYNSILNHGIDLRDGTGLLTNDYWCSNIKGKIYIVSDTGNADTEFSISHTLPSTPIGVFTVSSNKAGVVYDSSTANTASTAYYKHPSANATIKIIIF